MAQYFQIVDQTTSGEEPQVTYPNLVDQQGVHYIIQTSDTNQTFVLDNVLEQPVIQFPQQQQVYLLNSPPRPQQTIQPVVLNHTLQQPVLFNSTQQLRGINRAAAIVQRPRTTVGLVTTPRLAARGVIQANRPRETTPRPAIAAPEPATFQGNEMIKLEDGRLLTVADYQKLLQRKKLNEQQQQQQQQALRTPNPQQRAGMIRPVRQGPPRPAARPAANARSSAPRMPTPQAMQPKKSTARIIQPNQSAIMPKILRNFSVSKEIKDIINKNGNDEEFENSIRMYVLLAGGEQRLITFTTPKEDCTIQEILEQVGVAVDNNTKIGFNEINKDGIDIVVSVGYDDEEDEPSAVEEPPPPKKMSARTSPVKKPFVPLLTTRVPSPVLEPDLPPKFIPGKMAVCTHCGYVSEDFNKCQRCYRKLPENIKSVSSDGVLGAKKIEINLKPRPAAPNNGTVASAAPAPSASKPVVARKRPTRRAMQETENMVVTLSSDEEDDDASNDKPSTEVASDKEPTLEALKSAEPVGPPSLTAAASCTISCRKIRVGSHRFTPDHDIALNMKEMIIKMPHTVNQAETVTIVIARQTIHKVLVSYQKNLPIIFMYLIPAECERIAAALGMTPDGDCYFNSISENQLHRRIVLLPTALGADTKSVLQTVFGDPTPLEEINSSEANAILLKTSRDVSGVCFANIVATAGVRGLLIYPPGKGGISINTEDFMCLERDQFLNDVIIDFYLKYMVDQMPETQRAKVQVFSTFFYTRLTTKPARNLRRVHPSELDSTLTAAQKRHSRVKNWTKNIDLFEKDYIIVPINENAHWFLAIICFPGLQEAETFDGVKVKKEFCKRAPQKRITSSLVKSTPPLIKALKTQISEIEDNSDKDEAEGDDSEFEIDEAEEPVAPAAEVVSMSEVPIKQACILIFDSLAGAGRSRVVATLRDYLTCEYAAKKKEAHVFTKDVIPGACPKIPQQNNYTDCGLYLLQYVEQFFKDPIRDYRLPILGLKEWFAEVVVTRKREDISNLIRELMTQYKKDVSNLPTIALPTQNGIPVPDPTSDKEDDAEDARDEKMDAELMPENTPESLQADADTQMSNCESNSPGSESSDKSNRQSAMSYLKAKRIVKVKADTTGDSGEETKKRKVQE